MNKMYRVGIAGYGIVGKRRRQFIDLHPNMKTVAVCDIKFSENDMKDTSQGVKIYQNYKQLLSEDLDVLFVCLTNDVAAEVTMAGLNKGLHVFCEKPPGRDLKDIYDVIQTEKKHPGLKVMYGFNHRYHESVRKAFEIIRSGELGRVLNLRGVYGKSAIISFQSDWRTKREIAGGGILLDQGIHMVDLIRMFTGDFDKIHSFVDNSFWKHDVEDNAYVLMKAKNGVVAFLHSTATQWRHRFHLDISLEKGSITLSGILSGSKSYGAETITIAYAGSKDGGDPHEVKIRYNEDNSWRDEIAYFANCVINDQKVEQGSSEEAYRTMELVYRIYCADPEWKKKYNLTDSYSGK
ncbi:oxidoreductase [Bdellovibrio bacteriovorus]|uniref:Oxidoreductase n=1 Tax=Bdellovibrio bacteriovorus TaxID=959 RepID=A0A150WM14_BDEBC|nr:Gfo/Idh/MocA family oxidoreductase [Bdellovibrio bacteriovorus]KYG64743.1 oxidoreductase [Bdellovibrio bacteriovorus]